MHKALELCFWQLTTSHNMSVLADIKLFNLTCGQMQLSAFCREAQMSIQERCDHHNLSFCSYASCERLLQANMKAMRPCGEVLSAVGTLLQLQ